MAPDDMKNWSKVILKDMECDERSCQEFCGPLPTKARAAMHNHSRTWHASSMTKDFDPEKPRNNSSQWLARASDEAMDAIEHHEIWEFGPSIDPRPFAISSDRWSAWQPSSRPSSSWDSHALAESKGYLKGTGYGKDKGEITIGVR